MKIKKRNGSLENLSFDKIVYRLKKLANDKSLGKLSSIDTDLIAQKVVSTIYDGVLSTELDEEAARISISMIDNPEFSILASRIIISNMHKNTIECFSEVMENLYTNFDSNTMHAPILSDPFISFIRKNKEQLNHFIDYSRDYLFDYFGFKTLEKSYLMKINNKIVERPQHLYMRIAVQVHINDDHLDNVLKTYNLISQHFFTFASPTIFNSGGRMPQLSSCFLLDVSDDSIEGIFKTMSDVAKISKLGGGIGVNINHIRSKGAVIRGTNGTTDGVIPMLKVFNSISTYVNQSSRRKGSFAFYISPYHPDIFEFLDLRKNQGSEDMRARDIFLGLWISDLFMEQVEKNDDWYLLDPDECPGLNDVYGDEFRNLYFSYVKQNKYRKKIKAQDIWIKILENQIETGTPYILYKDQINFKSNQKNIGPIKLSNLCVAPETMILTSKGYYKISDLENKNIEVWNGKEFSETTVVKTGENQKLIKIQLTNGSELECTEYHKFYIVTGSRPNENPRLQKIDAKDLIKGMKIIKSDFPIITDNNTNDIFLYPYTHGLYCAEGTLDSKFDIRQCKHKTILKSNKYCQYHFNMYDDDDNQKFNYCQAIVDEGYPRISLYGEKKKLVKYIDTRLDIINNGPIINCRLPFDLKKKFIVPINYDINTKLRWFEGLCDGDGCIIKSEKLTGIQIANINKHFLDNVKYMLQTLGCDPKINLFKEESYNSKLPNHIGGYREYHINKCYRLMITSWDTAILCKLGFNPKRLKLSGIFPKKNTKRWIQVNNVIHTNRISDTFCFKEEKRGMGIFNGILTGQCTEITLHTSKDETAVCNLLSIALPKYVKYDKTNTPYFDHQALFEIAKYIMLPMNNIIDFNHYPIPEAKYSNLKTRPVGIGTQGLQTVFHLMKLPYESIEAQQLNREIYETIYYGTLTGSMELAKINGPYPTFQGSPFSQGKLQFDLWKEFNNIDVSQLISNRWNWDELKENIKKYGVRNSTLTTQMPTASTANILGNTESFEPIDSCIFKKRVLSGEYIICNKHLVNDLVKLNLWNKETKDLIIANNGSIQNIDFIPDDIKHLYKTVWEMSMKNIINLSMERAIFIDMTTSMNLFMANPTIKKLTNMHFYAWKKFLKTGIYYLRSKSLATTTKFSIDPNLEKKKKTTKKITPSNEEILACSIENKDECMLCSS